MDFCAYATLLGLNSLGLLLLALSLALTLLLSLGRHLLCMHEKASEQPITIHAAEEKLA